MNDAKWERNRSQLGVTRRSEKESAKKQRRGNGKRREGKRESQ